AVGAGIRWDVGQFVERKRLSRKRRRLHGERLRARGLLAGNYSLRNRTLLDGKERLAGEPVQYEDETRFGDLRHCGDVHTVPADGDQIGLSGKIPVPQVMMDGLKVPNPFTGGGVQRQHTIAEQVVALAIAAIGVSGWRGERAKYHTPFMVHAENGPRIHTPTVLPGLALPGVIAELAGTGNRVKSPYQLARACVKCPDVAARSLGLAVRDQGPGDHQIAVDRDWRSQSVSAIRKTICNILAQIDPTAVAETR